MCSADERRLVGEIIEVLGEMGCAHGVSEEIVSLVDAIVIIVGRLCVAGFEELVLGWKWGGKIGRRHFNIDGVRNAPISRCRQNEGWRDRNERVGVYVWSHYAVMMPCASWLPRTKAGKVSLRFCRRA